MSLGSAPGIVVLGGINMDLVTYSGRFPNPGETVVGHRFLTYAGGKGANQAVAAARMGGRTAMVGQVGDDMFGPQLLDGLRAADVDVSGVAVAGGETSGIAVIGIDGSAQNRIVQVLGANTTCGPAQVAAVSAALDDAQVLMLQLEAPVEVSLAAAREAKSRGKTVILDPGPVRPFPEELLQLADVITPNETEAEALVGFPVYAREGGGVDSSEPAERAAAELLRRGAGAAIIKLGAQGAVFAAGWQGDDSGFPVRFLGRQTAFPVEAVDTVAAGDAFNGALAVALAEGMELERAVLLACAAGALAVTTTGAQDSMPTPRGGTGVHGIGSFGVRRHWLSAVLRRPIQPTNSPPAPARTQPAAATPKTHQYATAAIPSTIPSTAIAVSSAGQGRRRHRHGPDSFSFASAGKRLPCRHQSHGYDGHCCRRFPESVGVRRGPTGQSPSGTAPRTPRR